MVHNKHAKKTVENRKTEIEHERRSKGQDVKDVYNEFQKMSNNKTNLLLRLLAFSAGNGRWNIW